MINKLLKSLIEVSEKSANIARICRQNEHLFSLLVEEKSNVEANPRFVKDFKTLADVLIQETIKHDIGNLFPDLRDQIKGEESNKFTNVLGETIIVEILDSVHDTTERLEKVLAGDKVAGLLLAQEAHRVVTSSYTDDLPEINEEIKLKNIGIWIDPIDATAEYIKGIKTDSKFSIPSSGLECVTVLIGVYDCKSGKPVIGIVNQPFIKNTNDDYQSKIFWGCSIGQTKLTNGLKENVVQNENIKIAILSPSENKHIVLNLEKLGYEIVFSAGAGFKLLKMITGEVNLYLLSRPTTFKWDTCAPHSILLALNYHLIDLHKSFNSGTSTEISYKEKSKCNEGGILAYRNIKDFEALKEMMIKKS